MLKSKKKVVTVMKHTNINKQQKGYNYPHTYLKFKTLGGHLQNCV